MPALDSHIEALRPFARLGDSLNRDGWEALPNDLPIDQITHVSLFFPTVGDCRRALAALDGIDEEN